MSQRINHTNLSIWVNTYNRPDELNANLKSLQSSVGDLFEVNVISNHSKVDLREEYGNLKVYHNTLRPDHSWGYLSRNWNQCYYLGLESHKYVLVTQDDMIFKDGWLELINDNDPYGFYSAPIGDLAHLTCRDTFLNVGWWDERFVGIDFQDYDYINRVLTAQDVNPSIVDKGLELYKNDIGLAKYWLGKGFDGTLDRPRGAEKVHNRMNRMLLGKKKGMDVADMPLCHKNAQWRATKKCVDDEIDWYPWFTARMQNVTGSKQKFMKVPYTNYYGSDGYDC
jgi:hypothetical protein